MLVVKVTVAEYAVIFVTWTFSIARVMSDGVCTGEGGGVGGGGGVGVGGGVGGVGVGGTDALGANAIAVFAGTSPRYWTRRWVPSVFAMTKSVLSVFVTPFTVMPVEAPVQFEMSHAGLCRRPFVETLTLSEVRARVQ
jgi:hypothetical protein